jgi:Pentapeptide repeats (8 copies)
MQFLVDAELVQRVGGSEQPIIDLFQADLRGASLRGANLGRADLNGAVLIGADLNGADLLDATGKTYEELERQATSLEGATMPNGQKCEDWIKSKGSGEGGKNSGTS